MILVRAWAAIGLAVTVLAGCTQQGGGIQSTQDLENLIKSSVRNNVGSLNRESAQTTTTTTQTTTASQAGYPQPGYPQPGYPQPGMMAPAPYPGTASPYGPNAVPPGYQGTQGITAPIIQPQFPQAMPTGPQPSIYGSIQPQYRLNDAQINKLFSNRTVYSTSVKDSAARQVGFFGGDLRLAVSTGGKRFTGSWFAYSNQMCYDLGGPAICSSVYMMPPAMPGATPTYFFVREQGPDAGQPSVIITGIREGNTERL